MGNSHHRRLLRSANQVPKFTGGRETQDMQPDLDRKSLKLLALGILWPTGIGIPVAMIAQAGTMSRWSIILLVGIGSASLSIAVTTHGWAGRWIKAVLLYTTIWGGLSALGWVVRPQPKAAAIEMKISPSGFPVSIPAHSTASILRINPYRLLDKTGDYVLKVDNTRGSEAMWPSKKENDSENPNDRETVYRIEITNHSPGTLQSGWLLFRISYGTGWGGVECIPPEETPKYQSDFVMLPQLDQGKSFEFYAVNETSMCAWLLPPEKATVKMLGDKTEREVPLSFNSDPLYASGAPVFPPTKISWEALPTRPNQYQVMRQEF
jgi:hypothetical protein